MPSATSSPSGLRLAVIELEPSWYSITVRQSIVQSCCVCVVAACRVLYTDNRIDPQVLRAIFAVGLDSLKCWTSTSKLDHERTRLMRAYAWKGSGQKSRDMTIVPLSLKIRTIKAEVVAPLLYGVCVT